MRSFNSGPVPYDPLPSRRREATFSAHFHSSCMRSFNSNAQHLRISPPFFGTAEDQARHHSFSFSDEDISRFSEKWGLEIRFLEVRCLEGPCLAGRGLEVRCLAGLGLEGRGFNPAVPALLLKGLQPLKPIPIGTARIAQENNVAASQESVAPSMSRRILSIFRIW